ncbi:hypothetical protein A3A75_01705 [Candidatus Woesebacteria bacterium RIFCSPLOWO2_01_FULL_39_10]|uniref:DUF1653 domain-containing protein n=1 Tax=Candidatus Woesebacteria bacterium RIFCSPLOWO2_01_FULL_39_10 TaxID=1802516 RepID=A0A1F8B8U8_9BACT|nr:MAG: hypothetical protein A3A75_01705 [Candidatus Woesebacteria bacterium RIFCSPLOWO2_01_FULL_39_10]
MTEVELSKKAKSLKLGIYEHYKKKRYEMLGVVIHSETLEELVLYKALYGRRLKWVRPLDMFLESVEVDGEVKPRFRYLGRK